MSETVAVLRGDGIGPEVTASAVQVLKAIDGFNFVYCPIGGVAMDKYGDPLPPRTLKTCQNVGAVLLGAVGGPEWDSDDLAAIRPEQGLIGLRQGLETSINIRPVQAIEALSDRSSLKVGRVKDVDLVIVRELLAGEYCGEGGEDSRGVYDVVRYTPEQIIPVARAAFDLALDRAEASGHEPRVTSVDKKNVWNTSRLWRATVNEIHASEYPEVRLDHLLVDNANYQIGQDPRRFDVIVTSNMFGDILSDGAANIAGSLGLLPSISLSAPDKKTGEVKAIVEPIHGSAPDIAGRNVANPAGAILSVVLLLRHRFDMPEKANAVEAAVRTSLEQGYRTRDLGGAMTTERFTQKVLDNLVE